MALKSSGTGASTMRSKKFAERVIDDLAAFVIANFCGVHQRLNESASKRLVPME